MVQNNGTYNMAAPDRYQLLKMFAKKNRQYSTEAERILWNHLRSKNLWFKFNRQHIVGDYIVDFICIEKALVIEVDGGYHSEDEQVQRDECRTKHLENMGLRVIRFSNEEIYSNIEGVLDCIRKELYKE